ncbi:MAG: Mut7-C RNAse domain-containing protein [Bacteroidota bacterium]
MRDQVYIRLHSALHDRCPKYRGTTIQWWRAGKVPILDVLKYINLPPVEVGLVRANSEWIQPEYRCKGGEQLLFVGIGRLRVDFQQEVHPQCWQDPLQRKPNFIVDVHAHKLARHLRLLGYDALCKDWKDKEIVQQANEQERIILTRDRNLLMRSNIRWGQWLPDEDPDQQVVAVLRRWGSREDIRAFSRCMECNALLINVMVDEVEQEIPEDVHERQMTVWRCPGCGRVYWQGTHYEVMTERIKHWLDQAF